MMKQFAFLGAGLMALAVAAGCAHRGDIAAQATPSPSASPAQEAIANESPSLKHYVVRAGDCLWRIAAKPAVLNDAFEWPLLYKQNRDEISDPDLIYPAEDLAYENSYSSAESAAAIQTAEARPTYHSRRSLPNRKD